MRLSKLADKVMVAIYKDYMDTHEYIGSPEAVRATHFPSLSQNEVDDAIVVLHQDGFFSAVQYADDRPVAFAIDLQALRNISNDTLLKRGYRLLKEIRAWFNLG